MGQWLGKQFSTDRCRRRGKAAKPSLSVEAGEPLFPNPSPALTRIQSLHADLSAHTRWPKHIIEAAVAYHTRAPGSPCESVLDLGCGFGQLLPHLSSYFHQVHAIDPSADSVQLATLLVGLKDHHLEYFQLPPCDPKAIFDIRQGRDTDLCELFPQHRLDCIVAASSAHLWDWSDPSQTYARLSRVLRPGGSFIILGSKPVAGFFSGPRQGSTPALTRLTAATPKSLPFCIDEGSADSDAVLPYHNLVKPWECGDIEGTGEWDQASHVYWVFGSHHLTDVEAAFDVPSWLPRHIAKQMVRAPSVGSADASTVLPLWTPTAIAAWLRQTQPFVRHARRCPQERVLASRDEDLAGRLVREACSQDQVGWNEPLQRTSVDVVWAIRKRV
ncbi:unnamed protein product [Parajaminaea phylloscopi]